MDSALLQRQEKSPCSRRNRGFLGDGLLDDAGSEAGDIVGTGTAGAGNADRKVSEVEIIGAGNIIFVVIFRVGSLEYARAVIRSPCSELCEDCCFDI